MVYEPYEFAMFLRKMAPGFKRLGAPTKVHDTYSPEKMKDKKFSMVKTKDEIVEEHSEVMVKVYKRCATAALVFLVGIYLVYQLLLTGSEMYLLAAMVAIAWAMYKWWHAGAGYSNYQEFEMRPILVPVEDIREPSIIPYWMTGKEPTFQTGKEEKEKH